MKILTNVQTSYLAGIGQSFWSLLRGLEKDYPKRAQIVGVKISSDPNVSEKGIYDNNKVKNFELASIDGEQIPSFNEVIKRVSNINDLKNNFEELIYEYKKLITKHSPDLVLINGTYYAPWCLYQAVKGTKIPTILHYHGILTKECSHYEPKLLDLVHKMETTFDNDRLFYIFPSELAKDTVEKEIFGHKISRAAIIRNSIPRHFFDVKVTGSRKNVAFVGRWSAIKNPKFIKKIAKYNQKMNGDYQFNIISDKEKNAKKELGDYFNKVRLHSPMDSRRLANFYGKMGVVLSPSFFETYGNVAQEAIATGTPAIVGPNMGVSEVFRELGLSQWIVDFKSTKNVYNKIEDISGQSVSDKVKKMLKYNLTSHAINQNLVRVFKSM